MDAARAHRRASDGVAGGAAPRAARLAGRRHQRARPPPASPRKALSRAWRSDDRRSPKTRACSCMHVPLCGPKVVAPRGNAPCSRVIDARAFLLLLSIDRSPAWPASILPPLRRPPIRGWVPVASRRSGKGSSASVGGVLGLAPREVRVGTCPAGPRGPRCRRWRDLVVHPGGGSSGRGLGGRRRQAHPRRNPPVRRSPATTPHVRHVCGQERASWPAEFPG